MVESFPEVAYFFPYPSCKYSVGESVRLSGNYPTLDSAIEGARKGWMAEPRAIYKCSHRIEDHYVIAEHVCSAVLLPAERMERALEHD